MQRPLLLLLRGKHTLKPARFAQVAALSVMAASGRREKLRSRVPHQLGLKLGGVKPGSDLNLFVDGIRHNALPECGPLDGRQAD
jgi:hypothetical protein